MKYVECCYQLWEDLEVQTSIKGYTILGEFYRLHSDGRLQIRRGYAWDGPTGAINTRDFVKASCVHDVFCELINAGQLPRALQCMADEEMLLINREQKMPWYRRLWTYLAVRLYQLYKRPGYQRPVYEVP